MLNESMYVKLLQRANQYSEDASGCIKVKVGSCLVPDFNQYGHLEIYGTNVSDFGNSCTVRGCNRVLLYGDDSKEHRLPSDCYATHSEIDAITNAARLGVATKGATILVTRYPCEACARAIVGSGIKHVVYARNQEISELTKAIFDSAAVRVTHLNALILDDTTR